MQWRKEPARREWDGYYEPKVQAFTWKGFQPSGYLHMLEVNDEALFLAR